MAIHYAHMSGNFLDFLVNGTKTCELRINSIKWQNVKITDEVVFIPNNKFLQPYKGKLYKKEHYKSFEEAIEKIGFGNLMPDSKTVEEVLDRYKSFPGAENIWKFGCVALFFQNWVKF